MHYFLANTPLTLAICRRLWYKYTDMQLVSVYVEKFIL